jgi:hypothetical protein
MPRFKTTFNGYSVKFSPFIENRLAVATAQNFGIIGNGRLHVLEVSSCSWCIAATSAAAAAAVCTQAVLLSDFSPARFHTADDTRRVDGNSSLRHSGRSV